MLVVLCLGFMNTPAVLSEKPKPGQTRGAIRKLFSIRHFGLVLIIVILLQAAHASYYNYGYIYLQEIQAPKYLIGAIINIGVMAEILFFFIADRTFRKFSIGSLLALAALGSTARWVLVFAFPHVIVFSISQTLHAFSFAMAHYAFMKYLIKYVPHEQVPITQGVYSALALSWSTALLPFSAGIFMKWNHDTRLSEWWYVRYLRRCLRLFIGDWKGRKRRTKGIWQFNVTI